MHKLHRDTVEAVTADRIAWTCANRADSLPNMNDLLPLANRAVAGYPSAARTKGAALVRAGRYEEALQAFDESSRYNAPQPAEMCFQAIACYHLGQFNQSQRHIEDADLWIAQADRQKLPDVELTKPAWGNFGWDEHLEALRLLAEAKALNAASTTASGRRQERKAAERQ